MSEVVELIASRRTKYGTGAARALRNEGQIPAIIYGAGNSPLAISIEEKGITKHYRKPCFISTIVHLKVDNEKYVLLPKAVDLHPIKDTVHHVDFVYLNKEIQKMEVPIIFEGKERSLGVKRGGFFNIIKRTVKLSCDVNNIPKNIVVNVTNMYIGHSIKASSITLPTGCEFVNKDDFIIATIIGRRGSKAEEENTETSCIT
ncbi:unnamed protein product [Oppiella nova]|uniref:General stress protein CTC n=1 Tax=Oppiella nova TaxID=334625 RepID=A0A7R9QVH3_9ACAR|nr:unnamed protein product [Oppiella nova]CAG2176549.1 unnamed protein product [Oppiella nova]